MVPTRGLNWRGGLLRLWIVASVLWLALIGWQAFSELASRHAASAENACFEERKNNPALGNPFGCFADGTPHFDDLIPLGPRITKYAALAIVPPLGLLAIGIVGSWIFAGFSRPKVQ